MQLIQTAANIIFMHSFVTVPYAFVATAMFDDLRISSNTNETRYGSKFATAYFGLLDEFEICKMCRIQRLLSNYVNVSIQSVFVSMNYVGLLACFSIMLYFVVTFQSVIPNNELLNMWLWRVVSQRPWLSHGCKVTLLEHSWIWALTLLSLFDRMRQNLGILQKFRGVANDSTWKGRIHSFTSLNIFKI